MIPVAGDDDRDDPLLAATLFAASFEERHWRMVKAIASPACLAALAAAFGLGSGRAKPLPALTGRSVPRFIAAVTARLEAGTLEPGAARAMLYAAQLMVSALKAGAVTKK